MSADAPDIMAALEASLAEAKAARLAREESTPGSSPTHATPSGCLCEDEATHGNGDWDGPHVHCAGRRGQQHPGGACCHCGCPKAVA